MNEQTNIVGWPAKIASAWALIGITSWSEAAAFTAFVYTSCLLLEWVWKKVIKPVLIERGVIKIPGILQVGDDANQ